jgi:excisionase family DNA binding protein
MTTRAPSRSNKLHTTPTGLPAMLSISQVADATGLSTKTIRRYISAGTLRAHRIGPRVIRIERDSVLTLLTRPMGAT